MATKKRKAPKNKRKAPNKTEKAVRPASQAALPAPATKETIERAAELLASFAATTVAAVLEDREGFRQAYRIIESRLHPGSDRDAWEAFQNAAVLLERHHVAQERRRRLTANTLAR